MRHFDLESRGFKQTATADVYYFKCSGPVWIKALSENVDIIINEYEGGCDAWLWVNREIEICLKLGFKPEDFENDVIKQIMLNP